MTLTSTLTRPVRPGGYTDYHSNAGIHASQNYVEDQLRSKIPEAETPAVESSKLAWVGPDLCPNDYIVSLDDEDLSSIAAAIAHFKAEHNNLTLPHLSPETFPLPEELERRLRGISDEVHHGRGFSVLRGLDPAQFVDDEEKVIAFCGLSSYIGSERGTNANGLTMKHIRSTQFDQPPEGAAVLNLDEKPHALKYHSDRFFGDVLALYLDRLGEYGGAQYLASFETIQNYLSRDALRLLTTPNWPFLDSDKRGDGAFDPRGNPIVFGGCEKPIIQLVYKPFDEEDHDPLSTEQHQALEEVQRTAENVGLSLDRQIGDIQFINNLALLHARDDYIDTPGNVRCFLRLSLRDKDNAWEKPASHSEEFDERFATRVEDQYIPVRHDDPPPSWYKPTRMSHG